MTLHYECKFSSFISLLLPYSLITPNTVQYASVANLQAHQLINPSAREASKRIVEDLLLTAGGNVTDDLDEDSPSVIKRGELLDEDTF